MEMSRLEDQLWGGAPPDSRSGVVGGEEGGWGSDRLIEQYKIAVNAAMRISELRSKMNTFFITLNAALIGGMGYAVAANPDKGALIGVSLAALSVPGVLFSNHWIRLLRQYRNINSAKFRVIGAIEESLPISPLWKAEWNELGAGKDPKLYIPLTKIEAELPKTLIFLYGILLALATVLLVVNA